MAASTIEINVAIAAIPSELINAAMKVSSEKIVVVLEREPRRRTSCRRRSSGFFSDSEAIHRTGISA